MKIAQLTKNPMGGGQRSALLGILTNVNTHKGSRILITG